MGRSSGVGSLIRLRALATTNVPSFRMLNPISKGLATRRHADGRSPEDEAVAHEIQGRLSGMQTAKVKGKGVFPHL
jgi:hypothetical protein